MRFYNAEQIPISIQFVTNFLNIWYILTLSSTLNAFRTFSTLILGNLSSESILKKNFLSFVFHKKIILKRKKCYLLRSVNVRKSDLCPVS